MQGRGTDCLCSSHSILSATDRPFHPPPIASDASLLSHLISPSVRGFPRMRDPLPASAPPRGTGPVLLPLLFFLPSFFHPTWLCGDLYCPFQCPRSSASVQLVFCEICSICRCILDVFVERDELHVLLLLCHLENPQGNYCIWCKAWIQHRFFAYEYPVVLPPFAERLLSPLNCLCTFVKITC